MFEAMDERLKDDADEKKIEGILKRILAIMKRNRKKSSHETKL